MIAYGKKWLFRNWACLMVGRYNFIVGVFTSFTKYLLSI